MSNEPTKKVMTLEAALHRNLVAIRLSKSLQGRVMEAFRAARTEIAIHRGHPVPVRVMPKVKHEPPKEPQEGR